MSAEMIARTIQLILAPVVMVTSCGLVLSGLLGRYAYLNERLRNTARERRELRHTCTADDFSRLERINELEAQIPDLLRRHKLGHDAVLDACYAIAVFVVSMFVIATAVVANSAWIATAALLLFLAGTGMLLLAVLMTSREVRSSHLTVEYEVRRVSKLSN